MVAFAANQAHARGRAALDLVLQAGARTVAEKTVLALAHTEYFLQQVDRFAHGKRRRIGTEITALLALGATVKSDAWKFLAVGYEDIRIALVVAQQNVVTRVQRLDEIIF